MRFHNSSILIRKPSISSTWIKTRLKKKKEKRKKYSSREDPLIIFFIDWWQSSPLPRPKYSQSYQLLLLVPFLRIPYWTTRTMIESWRTTKIGDEVSWLVKSNVKALSMERIAIASHPRRRTSRTTIAGGVKRLVVDDRPLSVSSPPR